MPFLDADNQPGRGFNQFRRSDRAINELVGMARGVMADGILVEPEFKALVDWLEANEDVCSYFPGNVLAQRLNRIMSDGMVTEGECQEIADVLQELTGSKSGSATGASMATTLPLNQPAPTLEFAGRVFCFTGKFAYGPRTVCEATVEQLGGRCAGGISRNVNFVVIGTIGSRDWIHSSYGRKIEQAVEYRSSGIPIALVSEDHWAAHLP